MKITYIHHSAFLAETESACLLFDYFEGELPKIPAEKPLYVFASHRHGDHFSEVIFDLADGHENIMFVVSVFGYLEKTGAGEVKRAGSFHEAGRDLGTRRS